MIASVFRRISRAGTAQRFSMTVLENPVNLGSTLSISNGCQFGFQSSDFSSPEADAILMERSLKLGSNIFVCSAGRSKVHLERLAELASIDDFQLEDLVIGNRIKSISDFKTETECAVESLCGRNLDFTTIPLRVDDIYKLNDSSNIDNMCKQLSSDGGGALGLELTTEFLRHCNFNGSTNVKYDNIKLSSSVMYPLESLVDILNALYNKGLVSVILCACNVFTLPTSLEVRKWANSKSNISFIAAEVLRGHPRSPGLLVSPSVSNAGTRNLPDMPMAEAIEMFGKALNTCIHMEKEFLRKVRCASGEENCLPPAFPPLPHLCVGMSLAQGQSGILFPQEWRYIRESEVDPNFENACATMKRIAQDSEVVMYERFLTVYIPMKRNLLRYFEAMLNARQELLCNSLKNSTEIFFPIALRNEKSESEDNKSKYSSCVSLHESISKAWAGILLEMHARGTETDNSIDKPDSIILQGIEVPASSWSRTIDAIAPCDFSSQSSAKSYIENLSKCLEKEFYATED